MKTMLLSLINPAVQGLLGLLNWFGAIVLGIIVAHPQLPAEVLAGFPPMVALAVAAAWFGLVEFARRRLVGRPSAQDGARP